METFEGKCDPQRLAKLEKRVGAADTPQESFYKSQSFYCLKIWKFQRNISENKISCFTFENSQNIELIEIADFTKIKSL